MKRRKGERFIAAAAAFMMALILAGSDLGRIDAGAQAFAIDIDGNLIDMDKIEYDLVHLKYNYGDSYMDQFSDYPYIAWMLDFADDNVHGYGSYKEGNGQELNVVCSTFIYYALYCTGYNVPDYISIDEDDSIESAISKIRNIRTNVCAETMYSRQLLKKWGFEEHAITPATQITDLKVGDILWIFDNGIEVVDDEDEGVYSEVGASRRHVEVVYETGVDKNGPYFRTVAASGTSDDADGTPYDKRGTEVRTRYYDSLRYKNRQDDIDYMVYYRPTEKLTRTVESRDYEPALISMARDIRVKVYGSGEAYITNDLSKIANTAVINSPVTIHAAAGEGVTLSDVRVSYVDPDSQETVFVDTDDALTFVMPEILAGNTLNVSVVFSDYDDAQTRSGWYDDTETGSRRYYRNGEYLTGFQKIGSYTYYFNEAGDRLTGRQVIGDSTYYFRSNGRMVTGWRTIGGDTYYFDETGRMLDGLQVIDGSTYFFVDGALQTDWQVVDGKIRYFSNNESRTGVMVTGLRIINGSKYYFDEAGAMKTGWITTEEGRRYFGSSGRMQTGLTRIGGSRYYLNEDGIMQTGWVSADGDTYYCGSNGKIRTGLQTVSGSRYFFDEEGALQTGWKYVDGATYYFALDTGKALQDTSAEIDGVVYTFDQNAQVASADTDGLQVLDDKTYLFEEGGIVTGWKKISGKSYYFAEGGVMAKDGIYSVDGVPCLFNEKGVRLTGSGIKTVDGDRYYMTGSKLQTGFRKISGSTYYFDPETFKALTGLQKIGNELYSFTTKGVMRTGLHILSDGTFYFSSKGKALSGWRTVKNKTYYISAATKRAVTGTQKIGSSIYHFDKNGAMYTGFHTMGGQRYYSSSKGILTTQAGFKTINKGQYLFEEGGALVCNELREIDGLYYYFDKYGKSVTGACTVDGETYYVSSKHRLLGGFRKSGSKTYYFDPETKTALTGTQEIEGKKYYFGSSGVMQTGLKTFGSNTYYFDPKTGAAVSGFVKVGKKTYYFSPENWRALTGFIKVGTKTYYMDEQGVMQTGWQTIDGKRYRFNKKGSLQFGWHTYSGKTYYFAPDTGETMTGVQFIGGKGYLFSSTGLMLTGFRTVDGKSYYPDSKGVLRTGWRTIGKDKYYFDPETGAALTGLQTIGDSVYYFDESGVMQKGTLTIDGETFVFAKDGTMISRSGSQAAEEAPAESGDQSGQTQAQQPSTEAGDVQTEYEEAGEQPAAPETKPADTETEPAEPEAETNPAGETPAAEEAGDQPLT